MAGARQIDANDQSYLTVGRLPARVLLMSAVERAEQTSRFHNVSYPNDVCSSKAKMSALSKVEMSVSAPFWEFGGCRFDGHGGDEQARAEPS